MRRGKQDPGGGAAEDQLSERAAPEQPDDGEVGSQLGGDRFQDLGDIAPVADLAQLSRYAGLLQLSDQGVPRLTLEVTVV